MAITVNQPLQGGVSGQQSNALQSFFEIQKPQISNIVFYNHKEILPFNVYKTMGLMKELAGETAQHYEAGWVHPNFQAGANATATGPGATLVITVAAIDVINNTVYPRQTDTLWQYNGNFSSIIAVNNVGGNWQLTLNPYDPTVTLTVTQNDTIWITGNSQLEGSGQPTPRTTGRQLFMYPTQTLKETFSATGTSLANELWYTSDQMGQPRDTYNSGYIDMEYRFIEQWGNTVNFQTPNINPNNTDTNLYGIDYIVNSTGNTVDYFNGSYGVNEFKENIRYINQNGSGPRFWVIAAPEFNLSFQTGASDVLSQNPNQFVKEDTNDSTYTDLFTNGYLEMAAGAGLRVDINFKKLSYGGKMFFISECQQMGTANTGGAPGWGVTGYGYFIPLQKTADTEGSARDRFTCTYKKLQKWNRAIHVWEDGAWATIPVGPIDALNVYFLAEWGTEFWGPQHFQKAAQA